MTKIEKFLTSLATVAILTNCNGHDIDGGKVYYVSWNEGSGRNKVLIKGADPESFKELNHEKYGIDKNNVYYEAKKLRDADPNTFVAMLDYYGRDKRFAYKEASKIKGASAKGFKVIGGGPYSKDYNDYYLDTVALHVAGYDDFEIINQKSDFGYWAKDKIYYYLSGRKHPLADYDSFVNLGNGYAKDKFKAYFRDSVVVGADPATFKVIEYAYAQDRYSKYQGSKKLNIKDPDSYQIIQGGYTKDKLNVYSDNKIIPGADPATFDVIDWEWERDKSSCFYQGKPMPKVDRKTFVILQDNYAKDKNCVYYYDQVVEGADPNTFKVDDMTYVGKDKFSCYQDGERVDCDKIKED